MKNTFKILAIAFMVALLASCGKEETTYHYSVSNEMSLSNESDLGLGIMSYAESKMKMGVSSLMQFTGTQESADAQAKAEFANRLKAIDEEEFCGMMKSGNYYGFILYRLGTSESSEVEIDKKRYEGTGSK